MNKKVLFGLLLLLVFSLFSIFTISEQAFYPGAYKTSYDKNERILYVNLDKTSPEMKPIKMNDKQMNQALTFSMKNHHLKEYWNTQYRLIIPIFIMGGLLLWKRFFNSILTKFITYKAYTLLYVLGLISVVIWNVYYIQSKHEEISMLLEQLIRQENG
ncbi:hypothetical protein LC040_06430 [Bacillus tianshenii]|nr:hypothetical protein LC040_06430 [Bacillus tianshenii]